MARVQRTHLRCEGSKGSEGSESSEGKVLKMDGPSAQGFLGLTAFQAEGCGLPLCGNAYKISVTDLPFCVIRYEKHYFDQPPPVAFPPLVPYGTTFPPLSGGTIKL